MHGLQLSERQTQTGIRYTDRRHKASKLAGRVRQLDVLIGHKLRQLALTERMKDGYEKLFHEGIASRAQLTAKLIEVSDLAPEVGR